MLFCLNILILIFSLINLTWQTTENAHPSDPSTNGNTPLKPSDNCAEILIPASGKEALNVEPDSMSKKIRKMAYEVVCNRKCVINAENGSEIGSENVENPNSSLVNRFKLLRTRFCSNLRQGLTLDETVLMAEKLAEEVEQSGMSEPEIRKPERGGIPEIIQQKREKLNEEMHLMMRKVLQKVKGASSHETDEKFAEMSNDAESDSRCNNKNDDVKHDGGKQSDAQKVTKAIRVVQSDAQKHDQRDQRKMQLHDQSDMRSDARDQNETQKREKRNTRQLTRDHKDAQKREARDNTQYLDAYQRRHKRSRLMEPSATMDIEQGNNTSAEATSIDATRASTWSERRRCFSRLMTRNVPQRVKCTLALLFCLFMFTWAMLLPWNELAFYPVAAWAVALGLYFMENC